MGLAGYHRLISIPRALLQGLWGIPEDTCPCERCCPTMPVLPIYLASCLPHVVYSCPLPGRDT